MFNNRQKIDKQQFIENYIKEYVKILPITDTINNDFILKQEREIDIKNGNEYMEK